jgi:NTP pyrophosphatase (non-canonical NTP hydrolase)
MGYGTNGLTFDTLRDANIMRLKESFPMCRNWTASQWLQALVGEVGEYANICKKFERGDFGEESFREQAEKELADIQCYLDLLAEHVGVDLGQATIAKWNEVAERVGSRIRIDEEDWHYVPEANHGR